MARLAHHGVALLGVVIHAMAHRQVAQPQQCRDRHLVGTGQAGAALAAVAGPQPLAPPLLKPCDYPLLLGAQGAIAMGQPPGPGQIGGLGGPQGEAADPLGQQEAVGQFQRMEGGTVGAQLGRGGIQLAALVGGGDGQHPQALP